MNQPLKIVFRERVFAGLLILLGLYSLSYSLIASGLDGIPTQEFLLAVLFSGVIIVADHFPIHIQRGTKVSLINLPIFLSTVLLPVPLAILATGTSLMIANLIARTERGLLPRDMAATVGQWMFAAFLGYQIIHQTVPGIHINASRYSLLLLCAFSFLLVDFVFFSLSQSFVFGEPFISTLKSVLREGMTIEVIQYLIAILGTLAAYEDIWSLILLIVPISITYIAFKNIKEIRRETVRILEDMADTVDLRDIYTGGHSKRVADLVSQMLAQLKISGPEATLVETAARLHDIGKIGIPDDVLRKPGRLSSDEMTLMRTHSERGAELIAKYKDFARGAMMIMHHHERWDGRGYPAGLPGHDIPFGARVIAVADSFDAMTSDRPYRRALSSKQAIQVLLEGRGKQWDASIVNAFVDMITDQLDEKPEISNLEPVISLDYLQSSPISLQ